jgi:hypothetical protein
LEGIEIEESPDLYIHAQQAERQDQQAAAERGRESKDYERSYVQGGGDPSQAKGAYEAYRANTAAEGAQAADEPPRRAGASKHSGSYSLTRRGPRRPTPRRTGTRTYSPAR